MKYLRYFEDNINIDNIEKNIIDFMDLYNEPKVGDIYKLHDVGYKEMIMLVTHISSSQESNYCTPLFTKEEDGKWIRVKGTPSIIFLKRPIEEENLLTDDEIDLVDEIINAEKFGI
jgi:hypothetical protein